MKAPLCLAAAAFALSIASTASLAADTKVPVPPRPYTEDDCQELNAQIDDSIQSSSLDAALTEKIRKQRTGADKSCNSGDFAAGARQLRRILDEVIEARSKAASP